MALRRGSYKDLGRLTIREWWSLKSLREGRHEMLVRNWRQCVIEVLSKRFKQKNSGQSLFMFNYFLKLSVKKKTVPPLFLKLTLIIHFPFWILSKLLTGCWAFKISVEQIKDKSTCHSFHYSCLILTILVYFMFTWNSDFAFSLESINNVSVNLTKS